MNKTNFQAWQQTKEYTCGASCLMVALNELSGLELSEENEIKIWRQVHPFCYQGSLPGYLGIYARKTEVEAEIHYSPSKLAQILAHIPKSYRLLYRLLNLVNWWALSIAKWKDVKIHQLDNGKNGLEMMLGRIRENEGYRILSVIEVAEYELHYILFRRNHNQDIVVMDPAYGTNSVMDSCRFMEIYGDSHIGFHVLLAKQLEDVST